ncbi:uncharacterized protein LOC119570445 [Penaeus monodon]|uniref:uncharacterized protein LOC119570445 n=1 Tax=Penaeus monodon TaxID=6687 RepID=UPI0018A77DCF|nr:uncharacterized protein LOC119570445 [Penaeus monodon]
MPQLAVLATDDHYKTVIGWNMETKVGPLSPWQWVSLCFLLGDKNDLAIDGKVLPSASPINGTIVDFTIAYNLSVSLPDWYFEDKDMVQPFGGRVTIPQVFARKLNEEEARQIHSLLTLLTLLF